MQELTKEQIKDIKNNPNSQDWNYISQCQQLSEDFIEKHIDKVDWENISEYQKLSESFIKKHKDKVYYNIAKDILEQIPSKETRISRAKEYAKKHNLNIDNEYLYAFRNHDKSGNGIVKQNSYYQVGTYYQDWHCDPRFQEKASYGFGIYPVGNTPVKVKIEDFCIDIEEYDNKARVWGFQVI